MSSGKNIYVSPVAASVPYDQGLSEFGTNNVQDTLDNLILYTGGLSFHTIPAGYTVTVLNYRENVTISSKFIVDGTFILDGRHISVT